MTEAQAEALAADVAEIAATLARWDSWMYDAVTWWLLAAGAVGFGLAFALGWAVWRG